MGLWVFDGFSLAANVVWVRVSVISSGAPGLLEDGVGVDAVLLVAQPHLALHPDPVAVGCHHQVPVVDGYVL